MDSRVRLIGLLAVLPLIGLLALIGYGAFNAQNEPRAPAPTPAPPLILTALPTYTPTPSATPVFIEIPTIVPPTATSSPRAPTPTSSPTPPPSPTNTRAPTRTPTPIPSPTNTPEGGQFRFRVEGGPILDTSRSCAPQNIVYGHVHGRDGSGLPGVLMRYIPKYGGIPELPAITRTGTQAGYYELTLGASANEWDIYLVDSGDQPLSPTIHFAVLRTESGECWWQLNWIER